MTNPLEALGKLVFSDFPSNVAYDLLKKGWEKSQKKPWEDLFLDSFQYALDHEKDRLKKYAASDGEISLNRNTLKELLSQELIAAPQWQTYTRLIANDSSARLAAAMAERQVLVIGGHNLPPEGYTHLVTNLVRHAREYFRLSVRTDADGFRRMVQELAEAQYGATKETHLALRDLFNYLGDRFDLILSDLHIILTQTGDTRTKVDEIHEHVTGQIKPTWHRPPFPGLRRFTDQEAEIFFGRERETNELIERINTQRLVVVTGASGSGKSSIVWAGVIPRVKDRYHWLRFTPAPRGVDDNPFMALAGELQPLLETRNYTTQAIATELAANPESLDRLCAIASGTVGELLLFVDQFEELFTLAHDDLRTPFIEMLAHISRAEHVRCILTVRSDFYPHCIESKLEEILRTATYTLFVPRPGALYEMIVRPAMLAGLTFEQGLPQQILDDTGYEPGGLALMAYALDELYKRSQQRTDRILVFDDYHALGRVQGAIGMRAEQTYAELPGQDDDKDITMQRVFRELVIVDERGAATRQHAARDRFDKNSLELIRAFTEARLLVTHEDTVEVAHEALFRSWGRLKDWIAEAQEDLILLRQVRTAAEEWHKRGRPEFLLWPQERLVLVYAMQERLHSKLSEVERDFIEPEQVRLERELETLPKDATSHERRRDIGDRLAVIGDTRPGIGVKDGLPDILWLPVKGSNGKYKFEFGKFEVPDFYIARYQLTYAQYQIFAETDYDNPRWWDGFPEGYRPDALRGQRTKIANAPRDTVSWYQSVAFARWLDAQLHDAGLLPDAALQVRLPTEWEWLWVAMAGTDGREYPWPGGWQEGYANTSEAGLNRTTAVGMYPHGAADCGALDMAGNLWEWCQNDRNDPKIVGDKSKMMQGGSFYNAHLYAAVWHRSRGCYPNLDYNYYGVRLVCAAPVSAL